MSDQEVFTEFELSTGEKISVLRATMGHYFKAQMKVYSKEIPPSGMVNEIIRSIVLVNGNELEMSEFEKLPLEGMMRVITIIDVMLTPFKAP